MVLVLVYWCNIFHKYKFDSSVQFCYLLTGLWHTRAYLECVAITRNQSVHSTQDVLFLGNIELINNVLFEHWDPPIFAVRKTEMTIE